MSEQFETPKILGVVALVISFSVASAIVAFGEGKRVADTWYAREIRWLSADKDLRRAQYEGYPKQRTIVVLPDVSPYDGFCLTFTINQDMEEEIMLRNGTALALATRGDSYQVKGLAGGYEVTRLKP